MELYEGRPDVFRFGDPTPARIPAYTLTVIKPGEPERSEVIRGHVPLSAALYALGVQGGAVVRVEVTPL